MHIYSALQKGEYHLDNCEDYLFIGSPGKNKTICAIMDGCTTGIDSHFISTLIGKLLRKICNNRSYIEFYQTVNEATKLDEYLKAFINDLFIEVKQAANLLMLGKRELLSTLILLLIDESQNNAAVFVLGDGVISINGQLTDFDQDNKPDYIGYHLTEDFEQWYINHPHKIAIHSIKDISIATDGVTTFMKLAQPVEDETINGMEYLLNTNISGQPEDELYKRLKKLEYRYGLKHTDDLAIIRVIK